MFPFKIVTLNFKFGLALIFCKCVCKNVFALKCARKSLKIKLINIKDLIASVFWLIRKKLSNKINKRFRTCEVAPKII